MRLIPNDRHLGWTPFVWLVYIVPFAMTPWLKGTNTLTAWTLYSITTLIFIALYFRSLWVSGRELIIVSAAMLALGIAFWPVSYGAGAFFIYAASSISRLEPVSRAVTGVVIAAIAATIEAIVLRRDPFNSSWPIIFTILIGAITVHFAQVGRANARLRLAHDEIEHLAKVAERERIARDLHDLLGHTLSVIILKSELASKLSERDPDRARTEIREVERISRDALAQVRAAVRGYRSRGLQPELDAAREALSAAGVALDCTIDAAALPPTYEAVLALAIREGVTNVVRHARAKRCTIALKNATLTISDDGHGGDAPFGAGLTGMSERVASLGGTLTRDGSRGTTLTITLPLESSSQMERSA